MPIGSRKRVLLKPTGSHKLCSPFQIQSNFSGSDFFGTMKISSKQGQFKPERVDNSARSGSITRISLIFYNIRVCCVFSLESPH